MNNIKIKIITHAKVVFEGEITAIYTDTPDGRIGILPNHMPITTVLEIGVTKLHTEKEPIYVTTMGGIMHFKENEAVILTDIAELGQDIDAIRAKEAFDRAQARLKAKNDEINILRAQIALKKAIARISATQKKI